MEDINFGCFAMLLKNKNLIYFSSFYFVLAACSDYTSNSSDKVYGIDVSRHQGEIDWSKVKEWEGHEIAFVYMKATEGGDHVDVKYQTNILEARKSGLPVGSYHYFRTTSTVEEQFENFTHQMSISEQDLVPLVDVEENKYWSDDEFHENLQKFLNLLEQHYGKKPMIYAVNTFYNKHLQGKYKNYHFLIGRYGNEPWMKDNSNYTIWQFSESGKVDGIPKSVDIDVFNAKYSLQDIMLP